MLNRCGENEHHYLVSQLRGKDFNLKPLSVCVYIYIYIHTYIHISTGHGSNPLFHVQWKYIYTCLYMCVYIYEILSVNIYAQKHGKLGS